jgi:hypothetical protein
LPQATYLPLMMRGSADERTHSSRLAYGQPMERRSAWWCRVGCAQPVTWALLAIALGASGCADDSSSAPSLASDMRGTMTVAPSSATPGQEVALRFPADSQRGIAFSLAQWSEDQWDEAYYLTSDWGRSDDYTPAWWPVEGSEDRGWVQVGISGPGPDRVLVPETAPPGDYLLCTANALEKACALLRVAG